MSSRRSVAIICSVFLTACSANLTVTSASRISCAAGRDCPSGFDCQGELRLCLVRGSDPPRQAITFELPREGDTNVSTTAVLLIALSLPPDIASASTRITLNDTSGLAWPVSVGSSPEATSLLVTPNQELSPHSAYTLTLAAGIGASQAQIALPTDGVTTVHFQTGDHRDALAPGSVSQLLVDRVSGTRTDLSWVNPSVSDLAGVLVLRKKNAALVLDPTVADNDLPVAGVTYASGAVIGEAEAVGFVSSDHTSSLDLDPQAFYDFAFFAEDKSANFAPPARTPFVTSMGTTFCPGNLGSFFLNSSDNGQQSLLLAPCQDSASCVAASTFQSPTTQGDSAIGTVGSFALPNGSPGARFSYRLQASGSGGTYRGVPAEIDDSLASLAPLTQPDGITHAKIGLGATAVLTFNAFTWPGFEAEVDVDPAAGHETWVSTTASVNGANSQASAVMPNAGSFKLHVRPKVNGCADAAWVESDEFVIGGGARYVSTLAGSDGNDGLSRTSAFATIERALSDADGSNTLDIYVAEGNYSAAATTGLLIAKSHVRIFGGYTSDFSARDSVPVGAPPAYSTTTPAHATIITGNIDSNIYETSGDNCLTAVVVVPSVSSVTLDQLTLQGPVGTGNKSNCALYVSRYSGVTISHNDIINNVRDTNSGESRAVMAHCGAPQLFDGNFIRSYADRPEGYGFKASCSDATVTTFTHNRVQAQRGVYIEGTGYNALNQVRAAQLVMDSNRVEGDYSAAATSTGTTTGIQCSGTVNLSVTNNVVQPGLRFDGVDHGDTARAFNVDLVIGTYNQACYGVVDGNVFDGGYNLRYTSGVEVWSIPPGSETFSFSNNLISAGSGNSQRTGARFAINTPCACSTPATQFIFAHNVVYARSVGFVGNDSTWLMNNSLNYSGRVVNNVFFGNFGQRMLSLNGGSLEAYQNNLVITDPNVGSPKMALYNNNGTPIFDMATLETKICDGTLYGTAYWRATGNQAVSVTPATLFVNPPTASDVALDDLLARDLHIKSGQAATLAFGLDTGSSVCGGVTGSAAACTGSGTNSCGNITKDRDGVTRPAVPAVGAYEP